MKLDGSEVVQPPRRFFFLWAFDLMQSWNRFKDLSHNDSGALVFVPPVQAI